MTDGTTAARLGFHSLREEVDTTLSVEGDLPEWLTGVLIRNGPGAFGFGGTEVDHWFDGLAMCTRFGFPGDGGVTYRNRFLRTDAYERARRGESVGGFATGETTLRERLAGVLFDEPYDNANVIVERVGDDYLALTETPRWVRIDPDTLDTLGHVQYDGPAPSGHLACAHVRRDPETGAVVNVETEFGRTCRYHVYEMTGPRSRRHVVSIPTDRPSYVHSFALTPRYVVLAAFPFDVAPLSFLKPGRQGPFVDAFEWRPDAGTRLHVIDREAGAVVADPVTDPCFGFHHVNAFETEDAVVFDLETVPNPDGIGTLTLGSLRDGEFGVRAGRLDRFRVTGIERPGDASVERTTLHPGGTALPTVSPATWLERHRYVYAQGTDQPMTAWPSRIDRIDVGDGTPGSVEVRSFEADGAPLGEPVFVPRPDGDREDDGVVLTVGLDRAAGRSRLYVVDGETMTERARATLPHAVPFDFHGRFFPELT